MKAKNLPTAEDALLFDAFVVKWQQRLNLGDWRIERGAKPAKNAMASVEFNPGARLAVYRIGDFGGEAITAESLEQAAIHELLHVFLFDLIDTANGKPSAEQMEAAEHRVVNVLEKLLKDHSCTQNPLLAP